MMLRRLYGSSASHLLVALAALFVAGFALREFFTIEQSGKVLLWFFGAIVAHDLILLPAYSAGERVLSRRPATASGPARFARARVHIRVPTVLAGLLLLVFLPLIARLGRGTYQEATSLTPDPYLHRWAIAAAVLYALSGAVYLVRVLSSQAERKRQ
jgi:hypothetical protein